MDFLTSLLPTIQHLGVWGYWLILLISLAESLAFVGIFVPGGLLVLLAGFLSAEGYLDLGDLIWFAALGAIIGDGISYWLGTKGLKFFRNENKILKLSHLERGERFFKKHGNKSVFLGRFIGPIRPIVPFVAGLLKMNKRSFFLWNITSAFLWAALYLLLGYFFGGAITIIETWSTRAGFFALALIVLFVVVWFLLKKGRPIFLFLVSLALSVKNAVVSNPDVRKVVERHQDFFSFVRRRLDTKRFSGLPLTLLFVAFVYVLFLFFGIVEDVITSDPIVAMDIRVANLFFAFRDTELISFFTWVTLLGKWQIVLCGAMTVSLLLWLWRKRAYIFPLWVTLALSELFTLLGKLALHRPRPLVAYYLENSFSFPSGHATIAVAFYGFLTYLFFRETKRWGRKMNGVFGGMAVILSIGLSRLYLDVHYVSDVWGGYLSGLLALIIGITLFEWIRTWHATSEPMVMSRGVRFLWGALIFAQLGFYVVLGLNYHPPLNVRENRQVVVTANALLPFKDKSLSSFSETLLGNAQEPLSFLITARDDTQFIEGISRAGWRLADKATLAAVFNLAKSALRNQGYPAAPMTPSFWNAVVHDFGFEKQTETQSARERHHARFWKTNFETTDGGRVYVGTVSLDTGLKWLVTHKISPDIDTERELLFSDLKHAQSVATSSKEAFIAPTLSENFSGDAFFTDGKIYIIVLQDI